MMIRAVSVCRRRWTNDERVEQFVVFHRANWQHNPQYDRRMYKLLVAVCC